MKLKLSTKAVSTLAGMVVLAMVGSVAALVYAWQMRQTLDRLTYRSAMEMLAAAELDIALLKQRGFVAFHLLEEGNLRWVHELNDLKPIFRASLARFEKNTIDPKERAALADLEQAFARYDTVRDEVIRRYQSGEAAEARRMLVTDLDRLYRECSQRCDAVVALDRQKIVAAIQQGGEDFARFTYVIAASAGLIAVLGTALIWLLVSGVFRPLREAAAKMRTLSARGEGASTLGNADELDMLTAELNLLVTEFTDVRSDLEESRSQLVHSEQLAAIGNTVAQVAHEIKNRLAIVGGFARAIEQRSHDRDSARDKARVIREEVAKLDRLLRQITDFSKPSRLQLEVRSLNEVVGRVVARLAEQASEGRRIEVDLNPATPLVHIDAERVEQVLVNLVRNALDAIPGSGTVTVRTRPLGEGSALMVEDDGPGIPEEVRGHIFEPFFTTKHKGTGLGLAICRKIIHDHGGIMRCDPSQGNGAAFTITLPPAQ